MDAIMVEGVTKTYRNQVQALSGVSFTVAKGSIYGLLGPNGAGKSTTTRILVTLTKPDGGRATVAGFHVLTEAEKVRRKIGYVAQSSGVDPYITGRENLVWQARMQRVPKKEVRDRVTELLRWVGLEEAADKLVRTYSGGMKRRLDIAMGLVHNPEILFLDEPTTGLDPESRADMWRDLVRLRNERDMTILLTTHYLEEADQLCDRLAIVDHGQVVVEGSPNELKAQIRGDTVSLELEQEVENISDVLQEIDGVLEVWVNGNQVTVRVSSTGGAAVPLLMSVLEKKGARVLNVSLSRPSLDDVYLHHTGRHFAAEENATAAEQEESREKGRGA